MKRANTKPKASQDTDSMASSRDDEIRKVQQRRRQRVVARRMRTRYQILIGVAAFLLVVALTGALIRGGTIDGAAAGRRSVELIEMLFNGAGAGADDDDNTMAQGRNDARDYYAVDPSESSWYEDALRLSRGEQTARAAARLGASFSFSNLFGLFRGGSSAGAPSKTSASLLTGSATPTALAPDAHLDAINSSLKLTPDSALTRQPGMRSPVMLMPGYGGSRLEHRLNKSSAASYLCDTKSDWQDMWVNLKLLLPYMIDCLIDNMRLEFDATTNTTHSTEGVEVRVKNEYESPLASVEYLHDLPSSLFAYFAPIADQLVHALNYTRTLDLSGAPYDFRKAPNELDDYFETLKRNSELMFEHNHNQPLTYICHSMGCSNVLYFLHKQPLEWRQAHVRRLISIAAPWAGSLSALRAAALGDDLGMPYLLNGAKLIAIQRSLPSTIYMFPNAQIYKTPLIRSHVSIQAAAAAPSPEHLPLEEQNDISSYQQQRTKIKPSARLSQAQVNKETHSDTLNVDDNDDDDEDLHKPLAHQRQPKRRTASFQQDGNDSEYQQESKQYFANDLRTFFDDIQHPDGYKMWLNTKDLLGDVAAPQVEVWCLVGRGHPTLARMDYMGDFPNSKSVEYNEDGDGTVTINSARHCLTWAKQQPQPIHYKEFHVGHMKILKDSNVLEYINKILES